MNHDYEHCADFTDDCPKKCFRAQLVRDLKRFGKLAPGEDPFYATFDVEKLPPHGRLIDADKLKSRLVLDNDSNELQRISADILKWIDIQETVIEGSET